MTRQGSLAPDEFFMALGLIASAQNNGQVSIQALVQATSSGAEMPFPTFEGVATPSLAAAPVLQQQTPQQQQAPQQAPQQQAQQQAAPPQDESVWAQTPESRAKYESVFKASNKDPDGLLSGREAVQIFGKSGMDRASLKKIWELADVDKDGKLDIEEFCVAFHLIICVTKRKLAIPDHLPAPLAAAVSAEGRAARASSSQASPAAQAQPPVQQPAQPEQQAQGGMGGGMDAMADLTPQSMGVDMSSMPAPAAIPPMETQLGVDKSSIPTLGEQNAETAVEEGAPKEKAQAEDAPTVVKGTEGAKATTAAKSAEEKTATEAEEKARKAAARDQIKAEVLQAAADKAEKEAAAKAAQGGGCCIIA